VFKKTACGGRLACGADRSASHDAWAQRLVAKLVACFVLMRSAGSEETAATQRTPQSTQRAQEGSVCVAQPGGLALAADWQAAHRKPPVPLHAPPSAQRGRRHTLRPT
jgi:hypothetical protein